MQFINRDQCAPEGDTRHQVLDASDKNTSLTENTNKVMTRLKKNNHLLHARIKCLKSQELKSRQFVYKPNHEALGNLQSHCMITWKRVTWHFWNNYCFTVIVLNALYTRNENYVQLQFK